MSLFLERALHSLWSSDFSLTSLVPSSRLFTGAAADGAGLPYVVLTRLGSKPSSRTSSGRTIDETAVRFTIWCGRLDAAKQLAAEIARRFDRLSFQLYDIHVLNFHRTHDTAAREADGIWQLAIDFVALSEGEGEGWRLETGG
ncbi:MAG: DUF3168 domain-containing protein [Pirellulales bacterium]